MSLYGLKAFFKQSPMDLAKVYLLKTVFFFTAISLSAQSFKSASKNTQYIRLNIENDMLILREKTDRYFTSGMKLDYWTASSLNNPPLIASIFPKLKKSDNYFGATIASNMYTPINKLDEAIVSGDRPYAGWAYLGLSAISNSRNNALRLKSEYSLGAIGPITQQEMMQKSMHKWIDRPQPQGWKNQIANDLAVNVFFSAEKRAFNPCDFVDILGILETNIGTVTNFMGIGGLVRVGWFEDYFKNILPTSTQKNWQAFIFTRPSMRVVMDNSLLQGGVFNYYKSPYVISRDDLKHYYLETAFGYSMSFHSFNMTYSQNFRTAEFKEAKTMFWGNMAFSYAF
jgi:lipid A 3-O-deacylase